MTTGRINQVTTKSADPRPRCKSLQIGPINYSSKRFAHTVSLTFGSSLTLTSSWSHSLNGCFKSL